MKGADFMRFFQELHDALFLGLRKREKIAAIDENVQMLFPEWILLCLDESCGEGRQNRVLW